MRRIYESRALDRDDNNPFQPNESDAIEKPQAMRTIPGTVLSRHLIPYWLRYRAISLEISTRQSTYPVGTSISFVITMKNTMPFPIVIPTRSLRLWSWSVDGLQEASHVTEKAPQQKTEFRFDRGERKVFRKQWNQRFQTSKDEWESAAPGEHIISAELDIDNPEKKGLSDETTIQLIPNGQ